MKAYFSEPCGDDGIRISFDPESNSDQFLLSLLAEKGIVKLSEAEDEHEAAFVIVKPRLTVRSKKEK
jgi:hypothetical protein